MRLFRKKPDPSEFDKVLFVHRGTSYVDRIAEVANSKSSYLEIGTRDGQSLAPVTCPSIAIDPEFKITFDAVGKKPVCHFYRLTSDDFFASHDPVKILGRTIDTAFVDGMHLYEYVLRDFINIEKYCNEGSTIFFHDCLPPTFPMTNRVGTRTKLNGKRYWTGDVWKIVPILREYRPELKIQYFDCPPTGLIAVSRVDPASRVLSERYSEAVSRWQEGPDDEKKLADFLASIEISA